MNVKWVVGVIAALALGVLTLPVVMESDPQTPAPAGSACKAEGMANLDLTMKDLDGKEFKLSDQKGKVLLLNFWATWCPPCVAEIPDIVKVYNEQKHRGLVIVGVVTEDSIDQVRPFAQEKNMTYPITLMTPEVEDAYGPLIGLPTSVLIARDGSVCKRHFGPISKEQLEKELKPLL